MLLMFTRDVLTLKIVIGAYLVRGAERSFLDCTQLCFVHLSMLVLQHCSPFMIARLHTENFTAYMSEY